MFSDSFGSPFFGCKNTTYYVLWKFFLNIILLLHRIFVSCLDYDDKSV